MYGAFENFFNDYSFCQTKPKRSRRTAKTICIEKQEQEILRLKEENKHLREKVATAKTTEETLLKALETLNQFISKAQGYNPNSQSFSTNNQLGGMLPKVPGIVAEIVLILESN